MLARLYQNHVPANLTFLLVLVMGAITYATLPREQEPTINFNWIEITTIMPGAAAEDVEKRVTDVLEQAVRRISDTRFVSSFSREGVSNILIRFEDIDQRTFERRVNDLRREIQAKNDELPDIAEDPVITEITSANAFPTAMLVVTGPAADENLRRQAELARKEIERIAGVDQVYASGLSKPELQVDFFPDRLAAPRLIPAALADTVGQSFRDVAAGSQMIGEVNWLVHLSGAIADPEWLAAMPVVGAAGEVPLGVLAEVARGREEPRRLVSFQGEPAVLLAVTKMGKANTLELVGDLNRYIAQRNALADQTGVRLALIDDQTETTRHALGVMQNNALIGLGLVLLVTWIFLGSRIAVLVTLGIPFSLAGTFWLLGHLGQTLNISILLGVVIALGMIVDDGVVVVEAIYYRIQRGMSALQAGIDALGEVFAPVTTSILTTMAAFLPLMLMPGIIGDYMQVIPLVVTVALAVSLLQAYWMLPTLVTMLNINFRRPSGLHSRRVRMLRAIRRGYLRLLLKAMRRAKTVVVGAALLFLLALIAIGGGLVRFDFFAFDPLRLFYVNVEMAEGSSLDKTLVTVVEVEKRVREQVRDEELQAIVAYAGQAFTETAPLQGDHYGQLFVVLKPRAPGLREVDEVIAAAREPAMAVAGPVQLSFLRLAGGPPTSRPINVKVRGDEFDQIRRAAADLKAILAANPAIRDISDDDNPGRLELRLKVNHDAARRAGIAPGQVARNLRLLVDGEVVATMQDGGEELAVRVRARPRTMASLDDLLHRTLPVAGGRDITLAELLEAETRRGPAGIRHYNFRRAITIEADLDRAQIDTVAANRWLVAEWEKIRAEHPTIDLDFSGELDDIMESLNAIGVLFLLGAGLIYLILGTQFKSYLQPLLILATIPMAFTGVIMGLLLTGNPLSLFTLYGVVALAGIAVNSAIVLISAANDRRAGGQSPTFAILFAARRRIIPILITTCTTIAGLFSLATGLGGKSLLWGPVATAIVWGLMVSTLLTLFVIPVLYRLTMARSELRT